MVRINYYDGKRYIEVEVSEEVAIEYAQMSQEEKRAHWRWNKRCEENSLDEMIELGMDIASGVDLADHYITKENAYELWQAIQKLTPDQQDLLKKIFFEDKQRTEIAKVEGVCESAIRNRLKKIYKKMKKFLN